MLNNRIFVIIIKDDSTSVTYLKNSKIHSFFEGDITKQAEDFSNFFKQDRFAKLFILLANKEQEYIEKGFENISLEEAEKLAKKTLKEGYNENVFRGMIGDSAQLHTYVFITIKINSQIQVCFNFLLNLPNYIHNIFAYLLEKEEYDKSSLKQLYRFSPMSFPQIREYIIDPHKNFKDKGPSPETMHKMLLEDNSINEDAELALFLANKDAANFHLKRIYKLYHPTISIILITEKLNFIMNILLGTGISLMIIIFIFLAYYF